MQIQNAELYSDGEVDLRQLFKVVWGGRVWVAISVMLATGLSALYAFKAQEWWTAEALVEAPQVFDYEDYYVKVQQFKHILDNQSISSVKEGEGVRVSEPAVPMDRYVESAELLHQFITLFNSATVQKSFLLQDESFNNYLAENDIVGERAVLRAVKRWSEGITVASLDKTDEKSLVSLKFTSISADQSVEQLQSYIEFVSVRSRDQILRSIETIRTTQDKMMSNYLDERESRARAFIQLEVDRYTHAYNISIAAKISAPLNDQSGNVSEYFPVNLGSAAILARVESLKSIKNLSVVDSTILEIKSNVEALREFDLGDDVNFYMFSYVDTIDEPLSQDSPKRLLIMFLGFFLGVIFGVFAVVVRFFIRVESLAASK